jgi:hypothetical protein
MDRQQSWALYGTYFVTPITAGQVDSGQVALT